MSIDPTEIRGFGVVSGSDRGVAVGSTNLRACWWSASGEFFINILSTLPFSVKGVRTPFDVRGSTGVAAGARASG